MLRREPRPKPVGAVHTPQLGELVWDDGPRQRNGVYMGTEGGLLFLRPEGGGIEWTTAPANIRPLARRPGRSTVRREA
ncbi:hypothetical protein OG896_27405 [Streptomyces sp. NBC_00669]|uniref:hypothetical protein n=1 Tax=unclassified Streptomyces TaxID=2593676 RepID=UPI002E2394EB|nr:MULTISPECIES: hypothetical protein [unclassified Streptomyces]